MCLEISALMLWLGLKDFSKSSPSFSFLVSRLAFPSSRAVWFEKSLLVYIEGGSLSLGRIGSYLLEMDPNRAFSDRLKKSWFLPDNSCLFFLLPRKNKRRTVRLQLG